MPGSQKQSLRVVVQRVQEPLRSCFRLVAYADDALYRPLEFASREELTERVRCLIPDFSWPSSSTSFQGSHIILSTEVCADRNALERAGLEPVSRNL